MIGGVVRKLFRLAILLAVVLAVPLQGAAAVSAAQCMALGHHGMADGHAHGDSGAGYGAGGHDRGDHGDHGNTQSTHCGSCAACCGSATISFFSSALIADRGASPVAALASSLAGIQPNQLDRPPTQILA